MNIRSRFYHGGRAAGQYSFVLFVLLVCGGCATVDSQLAGEMVSIPGGTFRMGDLSGEGDDDELPAHSVTVPAFRLGKYEVTVGQFWQFVKATSYRTDAELNAGDSAGCLTNNAGDGWDWTAGSNWRNPGFSVGGTLVLGSDQSNYLFPFSLYAGYGCHVPLKHSFCPQNQWYKRLAG